MSAAPAAFCKRCGLRLAEDAAFCKRCGAPRGGLDAAAPTAPPSSAGFTDTAARVSRVAGSVGTVTALGGGLMVLPWRTVATGGQADVAGIVAAGAPIARQALTASLRVPAIALLVTTALDLAVALISGEPAALKMAVVRAALGAGTGALGIIAGGKAGKLRQATGILSALTGLVMTGSMLYTAGSGLTTPGTLVPLIPSVIAQVSSLVVTVKMTFTALRGSPKPPAAPPWGPPA